MLLQPVVLTNNQPADPSRPNPTRNNIPSGMLLPVLEAIALSSARYYGNCISLLSFIAKLEEQL